MEPNLQNLNKIAATNGIILGIILFVLNILIYYVSPSLMGSTMFGIGMMIVSLLLYIFFTLDLKRKIGGFWTFREALKGIFLMAFIAGVLSSTVQVVFYKFIEPAAADKILGFVQNNLTQVYEKMGMDQDKIDEVLSKVGESLKAQFNPTIGQYLKTLSMAVLVEFIMSMIFAAIFKKEPLLFAPVSEEE